MAWTWPEGIAGRLPVREWAAPSEHPWIPALRTAGRRVADVRVSSAALVSIGVLLLSSLAFAGVARVPVFVDEANNVLGGCLIARGAVPYRDTFFHHFPLPYYLLASLGEQGACSVIAARYLGLAAL